MHTPIYNLISIQNLCEFAPENAQQKIDLLCVFLRLWKLYS